MESELSFWRKAAINLGFADAPAAEQRAELPILTSPQQPTNIVNLTGRNDTAVSTDRALGLAAVYRAVSIIGTSVSQLEIGVWRNGEELAVPSSSLIARPNIDLPLNAFLEQTTVSLATHGNAFWLLRRNSPQAAVASIEVLNPAQVVIDTLNGKTVYRYGDKTYQTWQIKHLWLLRLPGYSLGVGPIQAAQNELRGALDLRNYSDNWFRDSGIPRGVLKTDQNINAEQGARYADEWARKMQDHTVPVLGQGVNFQPVYLSPADAQFIESQQFSTTQIARIFGIPATYMLAGVEGNSMTYTNLEMVDTAFVKYTLMKYLGEIETALTDLLPRGQVVKFKVDSLLRADQKTRFTAYKTAIEAGFMTRNEVRQKEGLLPLPELANPPVASEDK